MTPDTEQILQFFWSENPLGQSIIVVIYGLLALSFLTTLFHACRYLFSETYQLDVVKGRVRRRGEPQQVTEVAETNETEEAEGEVDEMMSEADAPDGEVASSESQTEETESETEPSEDKENEPTAEADVDTEAQETPETVDQNLLDVNELKRGISSRSIIGQRLETLAKMRASQVKVNINTLQQMSIARETPRLGLGIPGFVVGIAMMLGMLGTFIGLAIMVRDINFSLPTGLEERALQDPLDSWRNSIQNIRNVLSGMKTAFSTTLVGLVCSICAAGFNFLLGRAQSGFFEKLERFTTEELLPATVPAVEDESLLEKVSLQMETSFERLEEIAETNNETLEDLNAIENAFLRIVDQIQEGTRRAASNNLEGVVSELTKVNQSISSMTEGLPETLRSMQQNNQKMMTGVYDLIKANQRDLNRYVQNRPIQVPVPSALQTVMMFILLALFIAAVYGVWPYLLG